MFWNREFLDSTPSQIDVLLQMQHASLSDILFEEDLLAEIKASNANLASFLIKPEVIAELVDNITQITEKDCGDKQLYSHIHAAYISCEILTGGSAEIFKAFLDHPESLSRVISCLTFEPPQRAPAGPPVKDDDIYEDEDEKKEDKKKVNDIKNQEDHGNENEMINVAQSEEMTEKVEKDDENEREKENANEEVAAKEINEEKANQIVKEEQEKDIDDNDLKDEKEVKDEQKTNEEKLAKLAIKDDGRTNAITKVVPQKAALISKLISTIHTLAPANLSCHITQDIVSFSHLIDLLIQNIDISGSLEILSTFIKRTSPPDIRYVFCEVLNKLFFVYDLISVMTKSTSEDKQRNACQLLCDIIVIGRQEASEQANNSSSMAQDMLAETLESRYAVHLILKQMFSHKKRNSTAIICGMKVLQTLLERKPAGDLQSFVRTVEQTQEEIEEYLIKFHELLLNPPKQEPIRTTFGVINKPLGYMRLEVVSLIRALISTNSPVIIKKLVELKTMKVIIDLFIEYSWNNLLHTQVEQALCLIINNNRCDEEMNYNVGMYSVGMDDIYVSKDDGQNQEASQQEASSSTPPLTNPVTSVPPESKANSRDDEEQRQASELLNTDQKPQDESKSSEKEPPSDGDMSKKDKNETEIPSRALLSQLLDDCQLIGRLLMPSVYDNTITANNSTVISRNNSNHCHDTETLVFKAEDDYETEEKHFSLDKNSASELERRRRRNGEQANFGHIIQIINSISINSDLDTIRNHLDEMKAERPELFYEWLTFVDVDVVSFKAVSLFYDSQLAADSVKYRQYGGQVEQNRLNDDREMIMDTAAIFDRGIRAYLAFVKEPVLPAINVDVLPKVRRAKDLERLHSNLNNKYNSDE